jgi:hypothetical protein
MENFPPGKIFSGIKAVALPGPILVVPDHAHGITGRLPADERTECNIYSIEGAAKKVCQVLGLQKWHPGNFNIAVSHPLPI